MSPSVVTVFVIVVEECLGFCLNFGFRLSLPHCLFWSYEFFFIRIRVIEHSLFGRSFLLSCADWSCRGWLGFCCRFFRSNILFFF